MITESSSIAKGEGVTTDAVATEARVQGPSIAIDPNEKHLATDHLLTDLKGRAISSEFVTIAAHGAQAVLQLASIMELTRILTAKALVLFAVVTTVAGIF